TSGEKRVFLVILFTSFSGSLVSRIPGAVQFGTDRSLSVISAFFCVRYIPKNFKPLKRGVSGG
ncbi:hypothetical protein SM992_00760, partial [Escherichia coli]|nr:hypothetical protein [Escherichia coli]MDZ9337496.1 hypothetical protein [Escherichia coli]